MVIDASLVKRHIKPKADSTLMNMKKSDLIKYIRTLEHNYNVSVSFNEQQARNIETMIKDGSIPCKWISVKDRLPKKITNKVLVYCKCGYIGFGHYEEFRGVKDWYNLESGKPFRGWDLEGCETYEVTHWMPLPEPPKEE